MNVFRALDKLKEAHMLSTEIEKQTQKLMVLQQQQQQLHQMALEEVCEGFLIHSYLFMISSPPVPYPVSTQCLLPIANLSVVCEESLIHPLLTFISSSFPYPVSLY